MPPPVRIAFWRSVAYESQGDWKSASRWLRWGIDHSRPESNNAQFMRLGLAHDYHRARNRAAELATMREIVAVKQRYPQTWGYYAKLARLGLEEAARKQGEPRR